MQQSDKEKREQLMRSIFENIGLVKRSMYNHLEVHRQLVALPMSQLELLVTVQHHQPISFKELARQLCLTPGAISQVVEVVEQAGYVTRENDPNDRRVQCLRISKKGTKLLAEVSKRRQAIMREVLEDLTNEELELWVRAQTKIMQRFQAKLEKSDHKETL